MNEIELLKKEIAELKAWKAQLEASHSIPLNVDQAFRARFSNLGSTGFAIDQDLMEVFAIYIQAVNEAGTGNYEVLKYPDTFLNVTGPNGVIAIPGYY